MQLPHIEIGFSGVDESAFVDTSSIIKNAVKTTVSQAELEFPEEAELSVLLADDKTLRELNLKWRSIDKPTNVLSFPGEEIDPGEAGGVFLGDIAISVETTAREAALEKKSFDAHFTHLVIHGFLHLFGYDHDTEKQALQMESLETDILKTLGISDPYESGHAP
ncbi:MAG: rRNA maturation RNase YbeY [Pseudomonadota bacterium]